MSKRITEAHPLHKKIVKLEKFLDKLDISISTRYDGGLLIKDSKTQVACVDMEDSSVPVDELPSVFEAKYIIL